MKTNYNSDQEEYELQQLASKKVVKLKSFYIHSFFYIIAVVLFILKEYYKLPLNVFPAKFLNGVVMIVWSTIFFGSAIDLFVSAKIFGDKWEKRKMKRILEKREKKQKWE